METTELTAAPSGQANAPELDTLSQDAAHGGRIRRGLYKNRFMLLSFGLPVLILLLIYIVHGIFPFGQSSVLRIDLYHQYAPFFEELIEKLKTGDSLAYSFHIGMGQNFAGNIINYLLSPFTAIALLLGEKYVTESVALIIMLKCACSSLSFCCYLKSSKGRQGYISVAFSLMYAMSAYFTAYYWNVMWMDAMYLFPLVILGIERIVDSGRWRLYLFSLAAALITNYYIAYMICIFSVIYYLYCLFARGRVFSRDGIKRFARSGARFALCSVGAAGLAAVVLIPIYISLTSSSAVGGSFPKELKTYFNVLEFAAGLLPGVEPTIRSSADLVTPNIFCGALTLFLLPLYAMSKRIRLREKLASLAVLVLMFFSFDLNVPNYIWHAFHFPNDLPYRQSFLFVFFLLTMCYNIIITVGDFDKTQLLISGAVCLAFVAAVALVKVESVSMAAVLFSLAAVLAYLVTSLALQRERDRGVRRLLSVLLLVLVSMELLIQNAVYFQSSQTKTSYYRSYDDIEAAIDSVAASDGDFYRIEKCEDKTRNDPALYRYCGISGFSSLSYENTSKFMRKIGFFGNNINSYTYYPSTPVTGSLFSLRYVISGEAQEDTRMYKKRGEFGDVAVYECRHPLPLMIESDGSLESFRTTEVNPFILQMNLLDRLSGDPASMKVFGTVENVTVEGDNAEAVSYRADYGMIDYFRDDGAEEASLTATITPDDNGHIFIYCDPAHVSDISISREDGDNESHEARRPFIIDLGMCERDVPVDVTLDLKDDGGTIVYFYVYSLDHDSYETAYDSVKGVCSVTSFGSTEIEAEIKTEKSGEYFVSIPYDGGWRLEVDGREADIIPVLDGSFISFRTAGGEHKVRLTYHVRGLREGAAITAFTAAALIVYTTAHIFKLKRRKDTDNENHR